MKYLKFFMSRGKDYTFPEKQGLEILRDARQIIPIPEENGQWRGKTLNKAHIVSTDFDLEREADEARMARQKIPKLPEGKDREKAKVKREKIKNLREKLKKKMIIK